MRHNHQIYETFVFLHGFLGSTKDWEILFKYLNAQVMAFDLPGHGGAKFTPYFIDELLVKTSHLSPFHLVGYSMGGRIAIQFAKKFPSRIKKLSLISTHLGLKTELEKQKRFEEDLNLSKKILETPIDLFLKNWYDQPLFQSLREKIDILNMRKHQNRPGLAQAIAYHSLAHQHFSIPNAHFIIGALDEKYKRLYQDIPHTLIENTGHAIHLENPEALAKVL